MIDPMAAFDAVRDQFFTYYDTPFGIADADVQRDRREALDRPGVSWQRPWFEPVPKWKASPTPVEDVLADLGLPDDLHGLLRAGMAPYTTLYQHQEDSLRAYADGNDVLVTSGTGSGKTEAMFIPLLAYLAEESRRWSGPGPDLSGRWWSGQGKIWQPMRNEKDRPAAMRAIVLYPMNALVEDQLVRLRKSLDSVQARTWWDTNRNGHRAFFGRYTGPTPVPGAPPRPRASQSGKRKELRDYLKSVERRRAEAERLAQAGEVSVDVPFFVPSVDGAEMRSRWDMIHTPPDILITNYSMLNIMLMRDLEHTMFERTRAWLEEDERNHFHLMVDELHMYRGTSGTEVAYLVRRLLDRLGLYGRPNQLRLLAASASLGDAESFLTQFFGVSGSRFRQFTGEKDFAASSSGDLSPMAAELATRSGTGEVVEPSDDVLARVVGAFVEEGDSGEPDLVARGFDELVEDLFPDTPVAEQEAALRTILRDVANTTDLRLREHLFFRNVTGIWACSDRSCSAVVGPTDERVVGKVFASPRYQCDCGGRVLQLWYCQSCGDLFLGGYAARTMPGMDEFLLLPEASNLEDVPERTFRDPDSTNYLLFWPRGSDELSTDAKWNRTSDSGARKVENRFCPASYDPGTGLLETDPTATDVWVFQAQVLEGPAEMAKAVPPVPTKCPACGNEEWRPSNAPLASPKAWRSSIKGMRTGLAMMSQVLTDATLQFWREANAEDGRSERAIAFSDSRQDAARLAGGMELYHHRQLRRQLTLRAVETATGASAELAKAVGAYVEGGVTHPDVEVFVQTHPEGLAMVAIAARELEPAFNPAAARALEQLRGGGIRFNDLVDSVRRNFLALGANPGGPDHSLSGWEVGGVRHRWHEAFDFGTHSMQTGIDGRGQDLYHDIRGELRAGVAETIFSRQNRDLEAIGVATVDIDVTGDTLFEDGVVEVGRGLIIRMGLRSGLDAMSRTPWSELRAWARAYVEAEAKSRGADPEELLDRVLELLGTTQDKRGRAESLVLRPAPDTARRCVACRRQALARTGDTCPACLGGLGPEVALSHEERDRDFFALTAQREPTRLHAEELTGQTGREDAQRRQAWFQGVFLDGERAVVDEVDLLSVTTTMEAGVDIGALKTVLMANMPPMRFNYQQRVGRAGRRDDPLSVALTFCRENSHDETFFREPGRITRGMPPTPFLDLHREAILERVLTADLLRLAFREAAAQHSDFEPGRNTHGEFGTYKSWDDVRATVLGFLAGAEDLANRLSAILCGGGGFAMEEQAVLVRRVLEILPSELDRVAKQEVPTEDLSQRLAEAGLLPMFGFPSRTRYLYTEWPQARPWPPNSAINRDLKIAISDFGPGAEVVKDKAVHTAVGIAGFMPAGDRVQPIDDPMSVAIDIGSCGSCLHVVTGAQGTMAERCPECRSTDWFETKMVEPVGFVTDWKPRNYDGSESRGRGVGAPRFVTSETELEHHHGATLVRGGAGEVLVYSDNRGSMYRLAPRKNSPSAVTAHQWLSRSVLQDIEDQTSGGINPDWVDVSQERQVALGVRIHTDTLSVRVPEPPVGRELSVPMALVSGSRTSGQAIGRKAAWYSLGSLLVKGASSLLEVDTIEFMSGIATYRDELDRPATQLVLADSLENGAGYSTYLARPDVWPTLMARARNLLDEDMAESGHAGRCDSSCYDCLREFGNTSLHPLLDWRLARTMLDLLDGRDVSMQVDDYRSAVVPHLKRLQHEALPGATVGLLPDTRIPFLASPEGHVLLITHPIDASPADSMELAQALDEAREYGTPHHDRVVTCIDVVRRPTEVITLLMGEA